MKNMIRAVVVDDTALYRSIVTRILESSGTIEVVDTAANGRIALEKIRYLKPDLVTLDVDMPELNGLQTLEVLHKDYPDISVVMVSGADQSAVNLTLESLRKGALDFVLKGTQEQLNSDLCRIIPTVTAHRHSNNILSKTHTPVPIKTAESQQEATTLLSPPSIVDVILMGVSTGGPQSLEKVIPLLPGNLNKPVLLVQHMPPVFTKTLADDLNRKSEVEVVEAVDGQEIRPGVVHIAPGGYHMVVGKGTDNKKLVKLNQNPPVNSCRPSVDVLFSSAAKVYLPKRALCIIMTGMGNDGTGGVSTLRGAGGGYCLVQSEDSCVVYGMPRSIVEAHLDNENISLDRLAERISELSRL